MEHHDYGWVEEWGGDGRAALYTVALAITEPVRHSKHLFGTKHSLLHPPLRVRDIQWFRWRKEINSPRSRSQSAHATFANKAIWTMEMVSHLSITTCVTSPRSACLWTNMCSTQLRSWEMWDNDQTYDRTGDTQDEIRVLLLLSFFPKEVCVHASKLGFN